MIDAVAEKGYSGTTVAEVVARAGVSRTTFYEQFANKEECLLVTFDLIVDESMGRVERAYGEAEGWPGRVEAAIRALFEWAVENPAALRVSLVEIAAAGPAGIERREASLERYERFLRDALELAPSADTTSEIVLRGVTGGLNMVLSGRALGGDRDAVLALVPDLVTWAISYFPMPADILGEPHGSARSSASATGLEGGRAPGTFAPQAPLRRRRGLPRGKQNVSRSFVVHSQRERILDAVANLTAAQGYAELKVEDIAEHAAVSLQAFYEHFADKEDAFLVAHEIGQDKALVTVERAYTAEADWRLSVRAGIASLLRFLSAEPSFAHVALVDALVATSRTAERSNAGVSAFAQMLLPAEDAAPGSRMPSDVMINAITGGIFRLCVQYALEDRIGELPELTVPATYIALAPFIGSEEAARVARVGAAIPLPSP
jgi:AcrR family transcriptional regulator